MKNSDFIDVDKSVDLTNCDREPIHLLGHTQGFGCFIALRFDWIIAYSSANTNDYFGADSDDVIASPLKNWIDPQTLHDIRSAYQASTITGRNERLFSRAIEATGVPVDISIHHNGTFIIIEFEKITDDRVPEDSFVRSMLSQFHRYSDSQELINSTAQYIQFLTGYDRVMVYQFLPDGAGEVIAEAKNENIDSFFGLRYPASDIPKQARALYLKNLLRVIHDVDSEPVPILPEAEDAEDSIDLSFSTLRAVSPIHIEYLKNMGVKASMSVSLIINGKLWGLIACHHYSPLIPSYFVRTELELFAEVFSLELSSRLMREREDESNRVRNVHNQVMASIGSEGSLLGLLEKQFDTMRALIQCDGIGAVIDEDYRTAGTALSADWVHQLTRYLNRQASSEVITVDSLEKVLKNYDTSSDKIAGVLAIPVSKSPRDYLLFFRMAQTQTVNWAGNPEKPVSFGPNGSRLIPRSSFALWQQTHDDRCEHWSDVDVRSGDSLRVTLLEVIIRHFQERSELQSRASRKHEVLISELNHRVRNILNLVNAIVMQTEQADRDLEDFVRILSGRMMALASAHDQLTASHWNDVSFRQLLETEIQAYAHQGNTIKFEGPDVALKPDATTPVVLAIHELFTNAAKYGALSNSQTKGLVTIEWEVDKQRGMGIHWRESGGPPVAAPKREGFGMILIRNTIPHELDGNVDIEFAPTGVEANIRIPARYLSDSSLSDEGVIKDNTTENRLICLPKRVLVVEDSLVIALDIQKKLKAIGVSEVSVAGNLSTAEQQLKEKQPDLLISDVHLGKETTFEFVQKAVTLGIPSIVVTGYGDALPLPESLKNIPLLTKPVPDNVLLDTLRQLSEDK